MHHTHCDPNQNKILFFRKHTLFLIVLLISMLPASAQNIRNKVFDAQRKVMMEVTRGQRDMQQVGRLFSSVRRNVNAQTDTAEKVIWTKKPYVPNSGMIRDYEFVYSFLHRNQEYTFKRDYDLKSIEWDSVNNLFYKNRGARDSLNPAYQVIGWHPSWSGDAYKYYNYRLLSMISFYSFDINPSTGGAWNPDDIEILRTSAMPDSAARHGTKVLISVTSLQRENNHIFLSDEFSRNQFMEEIMALLDERKGRFAGIDLDFEEIDPADRNLFTEFVKSLSARLTAGGYLLILNVPYYNAGNIIDYPVLKEFVSYFNVMAYDFSGAHSLYPGSISPLRSLETQPSLETAVNDLLNAEVDSRKIILSLPLFGASWDITDVQSGQQPTYLESLPYYQVISNYGALYNPFFDSFSSSSFFLVPKEDRTIICWYENENSLGLKFEWAKAKNLGGIGLWALGYDKGAAEIWGSVSRSFAIDSLTVIPYESKLSGPFGLVKEIVTYKKVIGLTLLVFAIFLVLGFITSLYDWQVRQVLFSEQSFRVIYSLAFLVFFLLGVWWLGFPASSWNLVFGLLIGGGLVVLVNTFFSEYRKRLK
jgi:spore germination protein YaaH